MLSRKLKKKIQRKILLVMSVAILLLGVVTGNQVRLNLINRKRDVGSEMLGISIDSGNYEVLQNQINSSSKIVGGRNFFVALSADGKVYGWGNNGYGQLAQGDTTNRTSPVYMNIDNVVDIAAGYFYTVAVKADGTVWTVGYNSDGELGYGDTAHKYEFVQVKNPEGDGELRNIKSVVADYATTYAVTYDGDVYAWGYNNYTQVGSKEAGSKLLPYKTELTNVKEMSGGEGFALALCNDGTVWTLGRNSEGQLGLAHSSNTNEWQKMKDTDGITDLTNVKQVAGGKHHTVILKNDGSVYGTGYNNYSQLGDGLTTAKNIIAPILKEDGSQMTNGKSIVAAAYSSWVLTDNNEIYGAGYNGNSQLGTRDVETKVKLTKANTYGIKAVQIAATHVDGADTLCYVDDIGRIYTVGYGANGELGNELTQNSFAPKYMQAAISDYRLVPDTPIVNLRNGQSKTVNATLSLEGLNLIDKSFSVNYTFKSLDTSVATVSGNTITAVGLGTTYIRIADETNQIYGSIKVNVNEVDGKTYPKVAAGNNHFIALKSDGTVYTWGLNSNGQLGNGQTATVLEPQKIQEFINNGTDLIKTDITDAIDVASGYSFSMILREDGTVWTAGYNGYGQLGNGATADRYEFQKVKLNANGDYLENIVAISAGANTAHALAKDGTVWSWGLNSSGQYGDGTTTTLYYPTKMKNAPSIMQISAGESHIAMLASDGSVLTVGANGSGQYGIGITGGTNTIPQKMFNTDQTDILKGIKEVTAGIYSTQVVTESGEAYGIGYNNCGQLAVGDAVNKYSPTKMLDESGAEITGLNHIHGSGYLSFATKNENGLYVSGYANQYQNFTNSNVAINKFKKVLDNKKIIAMAVTRNPEYQTAAVVDGEGKVWTVRI